MVVETLSLLQKSQTSGCSVQWTQWNSDIWWWGHCSLVQKGQTSGFSGCSHTVDTVHCVTASTGLTFFAPYTTIPLHTASTASSGGTFLHQRQCPHHHIPLFYCVLHTASTVSTVYCVPCVTASTESTGLTFCIKDNVPTTIYHYSTASTAYCIHWFGLFAPKTMSSPPYTTIPLHLLHTASTGLTFLPQRQCPYHHISLFHCTLHPLV